MSLLNPVLLPPEVKTYLSQGERFIKWDDVSGRRPLRGRRAMPSGGGYVCQAPAPEAPLR